MDEQEVHRRLTAIRRWSEGGVRAPHKPLVLLLTLARLQRKESATLDFERDEPRFQALMLHFGQSNVKARLEHPFWRLQNDGIWRVEPSDLPVNRRGDVAKSALVAAQAVGKLEPELEAVLRNNPDLVRTIVSELAELVVGETLLDELLDAVGMPWVLVQSRRDPAFRGRILSLYDDACAACGFSARMGHAPLAIEAAHVRWHAYGGPDTDDNGLALCSLHHKAFDAGAIGIDGQSRWMLSEELKGLTTSAAVQQWLGALSGERVRQNKLGRGPAERHVEWHRRQVFRGGRL